MSHGIMPFWVTVIMFGISTFSYIFGLIARQDKLFTVGQFSAVSGVVILITTISLRWTASGITPFISNSELIPLGLLMAVLVFLGQFFCLSPSGWRIRHAGGFRSDGLGRNTV